MDPQTTVQMCPGDPAVADKCKSKTHNVEKPPWRSGHDTRLVNQGSQFRCRASPVCRTEVPFPYDLSKTHNVEKHSWHSGHATRFVNQGSQFRSRADPVCRTEVPFQYDLSCWWDIINPINPKSINTTVNND